MKHVAINNSFPSVQQVSTGANHTTVLTKNGGVYTWGHCGNGRLGENVVVVHNDDDSIDDDDDNN